MRFVTPLLLLPLLGCPAKDDDATDDTDTDVADTDTDTEDTDDSDTDVADDTDTDTDTTTVTDFAVDTPGEGLFRFVSDVSFSPNVCGMSGGDLGNDVQIADVDGPSRTFYLSFPDVTSPAMRCTYAIDGTLSCASSSQTIPLSQVPGANIPATVTMSMTISGAFVQRTSSIGNEPHTFEMPWALDIDGTYTGACTSPSGACWQAEIYMDVDDFPCQSDFEGETVSFDDPTYDGPAD